jgi:hypothetical protein
VPLEIGGPDGVGGIKGRLGRTRVGLLASPAALRDELLADEVLVQGLGRRQRPIGVKRLEVAEDLASPPAGASFSELDRSLEDMRLGGVRTGFRPVGAVGQPVHAIGRVPIEPFVACLPADVVAPAELGEGEEATLRLEDESLSFSHGISLEPWHRRLPRNRKKEPHVTGRDCNPSGVSQMLPIRGECTQSFPNERLHRTRPRRGRVR